jgi:outer membrane lipopolysaccharide assembly protein LptE/RlpB
MRALAPALLALALLAPVAGCGYRLAGSRGRLPGGSRSLGIPTLRNLTHQHGIEQTLTAALLEEFTLRSGGRVDSRRTGADAVLLGDILEVTSTPVTFGTEQAGSRTFGTSFLVTVRSSVRLVRTGDNAVLWQNPDFVFRERYALNASVADFFSEENPALRRLARSFAASIAGAVLERASP